MDKDYLITIGLTTYNRIEMLKESVNSILNQSFKNFKLIIGNDYPNEPITFEKLGIKKDSRIKIVNHKNNIGEVNNMNFMLNMADTEWMMWFADDDLMHQDFLNKMIQNINNNSKIVASYSSYAQGMQFDCNKINKHNSKIQTLDYFSFISKYSTNRIKLIGCYGLIRVTILRKIGGHPMLGNSFGPYSDTLLPTLISSEGLILWQNIKLIFLRTHENAISVKSTNLEAYNSAEKDFLLKIQELMRANKAKTKFKNFINYKFIIWFSHNSVNVLRRNQKISIIKKIKIFFKKKFFDDIKYISLRFKLIYTIKILYLAYKIFK